MRRRVIGTAQHKFLALCATIGGALVLVACGSAAGGQPAVLVPGGDPAIGKADIERFGCISCHIVPGVRGPDAHVGPPLTAWAKRSYIAGAVPNDPANLVRWIMIPQAINPNTAMPPTGANETDARNMAAYLYTLDQ